MRGWQFAPGRHCALRAALRAVRAALVHVVVFELNAPEVVDILRCVLLPPIRRVGECISIYFVFGGIDYCILLSGVANYYLLYARMFVVVFCSQPDKGGTGLAWLVGVVCDWWIGGPMGN